MRYFDIYIKYIIEVYVVNKREMVGVKVIIEVIIKGGGICSCKMNYIFLVI